MPRRKTLKRDRRVKKGGKQIQEGAQGCTFYPALKCKGENTREAGMVSKLMTHSRSVSDEMRAAELIRSVDPDMKYSIYPIKSCEQDPSALDPAENNINRCALMGYEDSDRNDSTPQLLILPEGGTDLRQLKLKPEQQTAFFESFYDLLKGVKLYHDSRIVHLDIKPNNIVTKMNASQQFETKQIDFGLTISRDIPPTQLRNHISVSGQLYWPWELRVLSGDFDVVRDTTKAKWDEFRMEHIVDQKERFPYQIWLDSKDTEIHPALITYLNGFAKDYEAGDETKQKKVRDLILREADVQALGRTMQEVYNRLTGHGLVQRRFRVNQVDQERWKDTVSPTVAEYHKRLQNTLSMPFFQLCISMMHPSPSHRFTIDQAIEFQKKRVHPKWKMLSGNPRALAEALQPILSWIEKPIPYVKTPMATPVFGEREREMFGHNNIANFVPTLRKSVRIRRRINKTKKANFTTEPRNETE